MLDVAMILSALAERLERQSEASDHANRGCGPLSANSGPSPHLPEPTEQARLFPRFA
jgi:hypothetical protein